MSLALRLPADWAVVPLTDPRERRAGVARAVERTWRGGRPAPSVRREHARLLAATAEEVAAHGGWLLALVAVPVPAAARADRRAGARAGTVSAVLTAHRLPGPGGPGVVEALARAGGPSAARRPGPAGEVWTTVDVRPSRGAGAPTGCDPDPADPGRVGALAPVAGPGAGHLPGPACGPDGYDPGPVLVVRQWLDDGAGGPVLVALESVHTELRPALVALAEAVVDAAELVPDDLRAGLAEHGSEHRSERGSDLRSGHRAGAAP
ncbi:hypothetical protein [Cellulomonas endophytica]|uniref:hypothetical protein n=1 Tax=Cellulomonas endophytica TaxID=2494735 RepID=UPI001012851E|nr:hypothetical protein [Cellulomonas endophytica]